jgi:hypothetical protein
MDIRKNLAGWSVRRSKKKFMICCACELEPLLAAKTVLSSASLKRGEIIPTVKLLALTDHAFRNVVMLA